MGAGTGPLAPGDPPYNVVLTFDTGQISKDDLIYKHFVDALEWLLLGVKGADHFATFEIHPTIVGNDVVAISVRVLGPLSPANARKFNRAFNRLLWGTRFRRSENDPPPTGVTPPYDSHRTVTPSDITYTDELT